MADAMSRSLNIRLVPELRARADACATLVGCTLPELVREAIRDKCSEVERLQGQRDRARARADRIGGSGDG